MARTQSGGTAFLIAIALSASAIAPSVSTAQATGRLTGRVTIAGTGTPLAGITVSVPGVRSAVTNDAGQYVLGGLSAGADSVQFRWIGYAPRTVSFSLTSGETKTVDVQLEQVALSLMQVQITGVSRQPERVVEAPAAVAVVAPGRIADVAPTGQIPLLLADLPGIRVHEGGVGLHRRLRVVPPLLLPQGRQGRFTGRPRYPAEYGGGLISFERSRSARNKRSAACATVVSSM